MRRWKSVLVIPLFLILVGCGKKSDAPQTAEVKGKVTLDGKPLSSGKIVFDGGAGVPAAEIDIADGAYSGQVPVGPKTVRISAFKEPPAQKGPPKGPGYDTMKVNIIPAKYNSASKETREVKAGGPNEFDFAVTSK
jgi:hypothetical protein